MAGSLAWGIIGAGHIAEEFADGVNSSTSGRLVAVASRERAKAERFGEKYNAPHRHGDYQALLDDPAVQAVYIATPHPMHAEWAIKAAEAGKHLLVEKPIGMNWAEATAMVDAARLHDVFLMEAFMYRCHPQTIRLARLVAQGIIGRVGVIVANFGYRGSPDPRHRTLANDLGGGGILDVGCYPISMARLIAGAAHGSKTGFEDPRAVHGHAHFGETCVDEWAVATLEFSDGLLAQVGCAVRLGLESSVRIQGTEGSLLVGNPWLPSRWDRKPLIIEHHHDGKQDQIVVEAPLDLYTYEADEVARHIADRQAPAMTGEDTLGNMRALDQWRTSIGLEYHFEKRENARRTLTGRPLGVRPDHRMKFGRVAGLDKPVSRLILGCMSINTMPHTNVLLDAFYTSGGNAFDTSSGYGQPNGACEKNLGAWIRHRGIRDQVVIIEKGANFPNDNPAGLTRELQLGLERLGVDSVDIFMIHRDNEQVPIGEWVEVLNEHLRAGRMNVFGLSNFSVDRLKAFAEYADRRQLQSYRAVSNQLSLARLLGPIWDTFLVSSSDPESRAFFAENQIALFPWSSQARGFFTAAARPEYLGNDEWVRCWYSDENFARKARADDLAKRKGVEPINIALAWVLHQPFPTFPLVGPIPVSELRSTLAALDVSLSPREMHWLDTGEGAIVG